MDGFSNTVSQELAEANRQLLLAENYVAEAYNWAIRAVGAKWDSASGEVFNEWLADLSAQGNQITTDVANARVAVFQV
jgi:hypothetical protein